MIVNADDYGLNANRNKAIAYCFENTLCSSATIMANMPGFEEACALGVDNRFAEHLGVHLVLNEGFPLTDRIKKCDRFCTKEGRLDFDRRFPTLCLGVSEKQALAEEIRAQIHRCRKNGIRVSHIDSHHHVHVEWGIVNVLVPIAKEEGIPYIRIARNILKSKYMVKDVYKSIYNYKLKMNRMAGTKYFGSIDEYLVYMDNNPDRVDSFEVMVHPQYNGDILCFSDEINEIILRNKIKDGKYSWNPVSFYEMQKNNMKMIA